MALYGQIVVWVVAGLDWRFGWSPSVPAAWQAAALVVMVLGYSVGAWAMAVNRFFSAVVRIQKDRGHTTVTTGPYRYVRHPSYIGGILAWKTAPCWRSWTAIRHMPNACATGFCRAYGRWDDLNRVNYSTCTLT
ncbi:hypothetical protein ES703_110771 [subsurface metagenome]